MNPLELIARQISKPLMRDSWGTTATADWDLLSLDGILPLRTTMQPNREGEVTGGYANLVSTAYAGNGVVFACILTRLLLFSEARFQFQQLRNSRPGNLFGTAELKILEHPEPGKTTGDLLSRAIVDIDLSGNWYGLRTGNRIKRLHPAWVTIIVGNRNNPDASSWDSESEVLGYIYEPGGPGSGQKPETYLASDVAHFAPIPDPMAQYRGMSWLTPILREMAADTSATAHKLAFFRNAATPNLSIKLPPTMTQEKARDWIALFEQEHRGVRNAYRSMYFGGGAEATIIGANFQQMDFRGLQSGFETRIASAAGMHPVIVPFSEGLTGSSLNAGNFQQAARLVADKTLRPLWRNFAGSIERVIPLPNPSTRLWYDDRDIPFLRSDVQDVAEIQQKNASTISTYITAGFEPATAVDAVNAGDLDRLVHSGLVSVQLQPPGTTAVPLRATEDFWPSDGPFSMIGTVTRDMVVPSDHPIVRAFPSMFEPSKVPLLTDRTEIHCPGCNRFVGYASGDPAAIGLEMQCRNCKRLVPLKMPT
jgi:phage portal protein BeeE